jgi:prophage antirepressor-like protein
MKKHEQSPTVIPFEFEATAVRVIQEPDGAYGFVAKDVCAVLGHSSPTVAMAGLDEDEKYLRKVYPPERPDGVEVNVVSESGLYTLIIRSNKPQAKPFRKWVTSEVLPAIRKTGCYSVGSDEGLKRYRNRPASIPTVLNGFVAAVKAAKSLRCGNRDAARRANAAAMSAYGIDCLALMDFAAEEDIPDDGVKEKVVRENIAKWKLDESAETARRFFEGLRGLPKAERDKCIEVREGRLLLRLPVAKKLIEKRGRQFINAKLMDALKKHPAFLESRMQYRGHFGLGVSAPARVWVFDPSVLDAEDAAEEKEGGHGRA